MELIDSELSLYDPTGPWAHFEKRLRDHEARARLALETGPLEEVDAQRKVLQVLRDLLSTPERLQRQRELLAKESMNE